MLSTLPAIFLSGKWPEPEWATLHPPLQPAPSLCIHSSLWFIYTVQAGRKWQEWVQSHQRLHLLLYIPSTSLSLFSNTCLGSFCLTTQPFGGLYTCVCVCVQENSKAMLHCLRLELSGDGKKIVEIPRLLYWINHNSSFSSPSLIDYFIATRLSTCHHICIQPPENYAAPFPSLTLIGDCGFLSLRLQLKKINAGIIYLWVSELIKQKPGQCFVLKSKGLSPRQVRKHCVPC